MAKIQFGSAVLDARGKLAGMVYSANKGGAYIRRKASPTGTATPAQTLVRANFATNSKIWSGTLTDAQRAAWAFFAQANPVVNVFGNSIVLSGMAMMQRLNQILAQLHAGPITDPPLNLNVDPVAAVSGITFTTGGTVLTITTAAQLVVADTNYYVFGTGSLATGKTAQKNMFRYIGAFSAVAAATTIIASAQYIAVFGNGIAGKRVTLLIAQVNNTTGAVTVGQKFDTIVA